MRSSLTQLRSFWWRSATAALFVFAACALPAAAQQGSVNVSKTATSLPGPRYAWVAMPAQLPAESDQRVQDPAFRQRLQAALDKALQAKGYRLASGVSQADFIVAFRVGVQDIEEVQVKDIPMPKGGGSTPQAAIECRAGGCSQLVAQTSGGQTELKTTVKHSTEGGLLVEVIEPQTIRVLWRALARGAVKHGEARQSRLDVIAVQTLDSLPALPR
ncbi:MAG TPA: DUF4136 domain-containing protein [Pseudoxanthomonas sp.]|jgi:hypothetical protein|nr:DUF4136 domain-containing protein [Pseudoxanthomonas sp.]